MLLHHKFLIALGVLVAQLALAFNSQADDCFISTHDQQQREVLSNNYVNFRAEYWRHSDGVVSAYIQSNQARKKSREMHLVNVATGKPTIHVRSSSRPIILVLAGSTVEEWRIVPDPASKIEQILVLGDQPINLSGVMDSVKILQRKYLCDNRQQKVVTGKIPYRWEADDKLRDMQNPIFDDYILVIRNYFDLVESSFQATSASSPVIDVPLNTNQRPYNPMVLAGKINNLTSGEVLQRYQELADFLPPLQKNVFDQIIKLMQQKKMPIFYPHTAGSFDLPAFFQPLFTVDNMNIINIDKVDFVYVFNDHVFIVDSSTNDRNMDLEKTRIFFVTKNSKDFVIRHFGRFAPIGHFESEGRELWDSKKYQSDIFVVFEKGISPKDMIWDDPFTLRNTKTGSRLIFTSELRYENFIFYDDGEFEKFNWPKFYENL